MFAFDSNLETFVCEKNNNRKEAPTFGIKCVCTWLLSVERRFCRGGFFFMYVEIVHERGVTMGKDTLEINFCKTFGLFSSENNQFLKICESFSKKLELEVFGF